MLPLKIAAVLAALVLTTSCATKTQTETVYLEPECTVPPSPTLNPPYWEDLLLPFEYMPEDAKDTEQFDYALVLLEDYDAAQRGYILELVSVLEGFCTNPS